MHIGWGNIPQFCFLFCTFVMIFQFLPVFISHNDAAVNYCTYQREQPGVTTHSTMGQHFKPFPINIFITSNTEHLYLLTP